MLIAENLKRLQSTWINVDRFVRSYPHLSMKGSHPYCLIQGYNNLRSMGLSKWHINYALLLTMSRVLALLKLKNNVKYI